MASITLNLSQKQSDLLVDDYRADLASVYMIEKEVIKCNLPIEGFFLEPGAYVIFFEGTLTQHEAFLKAMFPGKPTPMALMARGMWMYETPATKHAKPENQILVNISAT